MSDVAAYRVDLDQFSGPMDLLLHLLREDELDVERIPVARVCDRYLEHLADLDRIDLDAAGDFLVMASTLMRIKSQALLPAEDQLLEDDDLDPRFELVRQLIQYRRFKHVAELLDERREQASRRFARAAAPELGEVPPEQPTEVTIDGAGIELLFTAFARLLNEIRPYKDFVVTFDDTPLADHVKRVEALVPAGTRIGFRSLVPVGSSRGFMIGVFLAVLELLKRGVVSVLQSEPFGPIELIGCDASADAERPS